MGEADGANPGTRVSERTRERWWLAGVLGVGAVACALAHLQFEGAKLAGDQAYYVHVTEQIINGLGHESALRPPLYPYFMAAVTWFPPHSLVAVQIAQVPLTLLSTLLVFRLCARRFGLRAAVISGGLCALQPSLVHYSHFVWAETLATPLLALFVFFLDRFDREERLCDVVFAGLALGLLALTKEVWLYFGAVAAGWLLTRRGAEWSRALPAAAILVCTLVLTVAPWTTRNFLLSSRLIPVSLNKWFPIAMGNLYPTDDWYLGNTPKEERMALVAKVNELPGHEREAAWREIALQQIAADQPWWIFKKAIRGPAALYDLHTQQLRFVQQGWVETSEWEAYAMVVADAIGYFGVMLPGIVALWWVPAGWTRSLVVLCILYLTAVHTVANATPRFHVPLLPLFIVYIGPLFSGAVVWREVPLWRRVGALSSVVAFLVIPMPRTAAFVRDVWIGIGQPIVG